MRAAIETDERSLNATSEAYRNFWPVARLTACFASSDIPDVTGVAALTVLCPSQLDRIGMRLCDFENDIKPFLIGIRYILRQS